MIPHYFFVALFPLFDLLGMSGLCVILGASFV